MSSNLCAAVSAALLAGCTTIVVAQRAGTSRSASAPASAPDSATTRPDITASPGYRSAFEGYRPFAEQPLTSWRQANDLVGRIGGWQAYAREAQGGAVAGSASAASDASGAPPMGNMPGMHRHATPKGSATAPANVPPSIKTPSTVPTAASSPSHATPGHKMP
jgi:hypothetical protein